MQWPPHPRYAVVRLGVGERHRLSADAVKAHTAVFFSALSLSLHLLAHLWTNQVLSLLNKSINVLEIWMRLSCMWIFASFHAVSQSVFPVSLCKPPTKKRRQKIYITKEKKHSSCLEDWTQPKGKNTPWVTEPDVDLTPMHIPRISGDISKQIYRIIDHVSEMFVQKRKKKNNRIKVLIFFLLFWFVIHLSQHLPFQNCDVSEYLVFWSVFKSSERWNLSWNCNCLQSKCTLYFLQSRRLR